MADRTRRRSSMPRSPGTRRPPPTAACASWAESSSALEDVAEGLAAHTGEREHASAQRAGLVGVPAVEETGGGLHRPAERLVVGVPPEVAGARGLPGEQLDVHALVQPELRV